MLIVLIGNTKIKKKRKDKKKFIFFSLEVHYAVLESRMWHFIDFSISALSSMPFYFTL